MPHEQELFSNLAAGFCRMFQAWYACQSCYASLPPDVPMPKPETDHSPARKVLLQVENKVDARRGAKEAARKNWEDRGTRHGS